MGNNAIFWMSENSTSQIVFRTDIFLKLTLDAPEDSSAVLAALVVNFSKGSTILLLR